MTITRRRTSRLRTSGGGMTRRQFLAAAIAVGGLLMVVEAVAHLAQTPIWLLAGALNKADLPISHSTALFVECASYALVGFALIAGRGWLARLVESPGMALPGTDPSRILDAAVRLTGLTLVAVSLPVVGSSAFAVARIFFARWGTFGSPPLHEGHLADAVVSVLIGLALAFRPARGDQRTQADVR